MVVCDLATFTPSYTVSVTLREGPDGKSQTLYSNHIVNINPYFTQSKQSSVLEKPATEDSKRMKRRRAEEDTPELDKLRQTKRLPPIHGEVIDLTVTGTEMLDPADPFPKCTEL
jgi:hypothetical protein